MSQLIIGPVSPFFIVRSLPRSIDFYTRILGFELRLETPSEVPFFAIVGRDSMQLCLKAIDVDNRPNHLMHEWAPWDAFVYVARPALLAEDFESHGALLHQPLRERDDDLLGFEIRDPDGYTMFFGRPIQD